VVGFTPAREIVSSPFGLFHSVIPVPRAIEYLNRHARPNVVIDSEFSLWDVLGCALGVSFGILLVITRVSAHLPQK
jgi:hypothetical protein